ncbi:MAG TPA: HAD-IIB family hydrolase [Candidatus Saccharicenans sp.]|jgi:mannosyl-3-phosphoglycerate phosphatase|nr:HAD-IIB family hydrolase [Candidatus Saccharicenans sp.]HRD02912.1 HAD-IIB family hydrolase [Candidatus Saccharicenans sp.]
MANRFVVFTDLDGTLLDAETYSFQAAQPALEKLKKKQVPVVLCTSKTRAETEVIARQLDLKHPFIVENGGAIFISPGYFTPEQLKNSGYKPKRKGNYLVIELGLPYRQLRQFLVNMRKSFPLKVKGFGDCRPEEIARITGLSLGEARLAARREYDEPCQLEDSAQIRLLRQKAREAGLKVVRGGRFIHLTGNNDKGRAVRILKKLYRRKFGQIISLGLGDAANDWPMLKEVELPVLVARPDGQPVVLKKLPENIYKTKKAGPAGWTEAVNYWLKSGQLEV